LGKLPAASLEIRVLAHATENPEKVYRALENVAGWEALEEVEVKRQKLEGHYGNPIILYAWKTGKKSLIRKVLLGLFPRIMEPDRRLLLAGLEERIDEEGNFYLRLDKQEAYLGRIKLGEADPIRLKVKLAIPARQRKKLLKAFESLLEGKVDP